ncbi:MAG: Flp pilus assembly complex ATPase component TadA [Oscillospiraceae bacterium]|nr:Flp pilus assembly complex ATPase component TadA [Oscillospiraceae bacterium]
MNGFKSAIELLQPKLRQTFERLPPIKIDSINEIRLRLGRHVSVSTVKGNSYITETGELTENSAFAIVTEPSDIEYTFKNAFSYSLHSYSKELCMGYITVGSGNRVGICGTAVTNASDLRSVETIKYVSSINIRIAREKRGFAEKLINMCMIPKPSGVLIIGAPASGKTTLLRDTTRLMSSRFKISLIDEQNEISATHRDTAQNDIGELTDVFVGYPKHIGISTAVRVMSPDVIVVDEIGSEEELQAIEFALHSGVTLITAVHSESLEEAKKKRIVKALISENAFQYAAVLGRNYEYEIIKID